VSFQVHWILVCCNKVATRGSCKDGVWSLNVLDCDGVVSDWSSVSDEGKRTSAKKFVGCR